MFLFLAFPVHYDRVSRRQTGERPMNSKGIQFAVFAAFALLLGVVILFGSWYRIGQTERGVVTRNGATIGMAQPGLGFKIPIIDDVIKVPVTTATNHWKKMDTYSF